MFKKFLSAGVGVGMLLVTATPALAFEWHFPRSSGTTISNNADVNNYVRTTSNTGYNSLTSTSRFHGGVMMSDITTGQALSGAMVVNNVNTVAVDNCGCNSRTSLTIKNDADLTNKVNTTSNTGYNSILGGKLFGSDISTGPAGAESVVENVVNTVGSFSELE